MDSKIGVWVSRLKDPNPETRLKAIDALEMLGDMSALVPLSQIFVTDPQAQVRQAAQKAGKAIYHNLLRREEKPDIASDEERQRAAAILAQANARKQNRN